MKAVFDGRISMPYCRRRGDSLTRFPTSNTKPYKCEYIETSSVESKVDSMPAMSSARQTMRYLRTHRTVAPWWRAYFRAIYLAAFSVPYYYYYFDIYSKWETSIERLCYFSLMHPPFLYKIICDSNSPFVYRRRHLLRRKKKKTKTLSTNTEHCHCCLHITCLPQLTL